MNYSDTSEKYTSRLKDITKGFIAEPIRLMSDNNWDNFSKYGIAYNIGFPLLSRKYLKDFDYLSSRLKKIAPDIRLYTQNDIHISLCVVIRIDKLTTKPKLYTPTQPKQRYYSNYLKILSNLKEAPFSLKIVGIFPNGIILWKPCTNPEAIFSIRKQLSTELHSTKKLKFDMNTSGNPIMPNIIHSTIFSLPLESTSKIQNSIRKTLQELNIEITHGKIFNTELKINSINFMEERITSSEYNTEILETRLLQRRFQ